MYRRAWRCQRPGDSARPVSAVACSPTLPPLGQTVEREEDYLPKSTTTLSMYRVMAVKPCV